MTGLKHLDEGRLIVQIDGGVARDARRECDHMGSAERQFGEVSTLMSAWERLPFKWSFADDYSVV